MMALQIIAVVIIGIWICSLGPLLGCSIDYGIESFEDMFNPVVRYESGEFNLFGVVVITVVLNVMFMPMSVIYWFYKLCTIGR